MIKFCTVFFIALAMYALAVSSVGGAVLFLCCALLASWGDRAFDAQEKEHRNNPKNAQTPPGTLQLLDEHACESSSSDWWPTFQFGKPDSDSKS